MKNEARPECKVLGVIGLFGGTNESEYQDLNDLTKGIYYNGNGGNQSFNFINYPTSILDSSNTQIAVIAIANGWGGRGYQIAFSKLGIAVRYNSGTWQPWIEKLWRKWPDD